nr:MAG TPA: Papain-like cysteine protease AvrRpt2 [Caudoviricetes sp.]
MVMIFFSAIFFIDDKELKKDVVEKVTDTVTDIATREMSKEEIESLPSTEIIEQTEEQENAVSNEQEGEETEGFQLQGEIAYEGAKAETWNVELGDYVGLTYYSQLDSRWASKMYSSVGNSNQTIGSSACGPTCASMVVTATKGAITPDTMCDLFVQHGYRSANNGTYFSAFRAVADEFDIGYEETYYLDKAVELLRNNHYVIVSCGNGLFTTGGHFIVLVGIDGDTLKIYDPYLYSGKFSTSTRRGKVTVDGNTVYCSIDNFRNYANYSKFFAFAHDGNVQVNNTRPVTTQAYTRYVNAKIGLNIRNKPNGYIVGGLSNGTAVTVYETDGNWSRIGTNKWVSSNYLTSYMAVASNPVKTISGVKYTTGKYKVNASVLNVRTGPSTKYKIKGYKQLTSNARYQNKRLGNQYTNGLKRGVVTTVIKVRNGFGLTPSGWIALNYCTKM